MKNYFGGKWCNGQNNHLTAVTNLMANYPLNPNPNFSNNVPGQPNYYNPPQPLVNSFPNQLVTQGGWNLGDGNNNQVTSGRPNPVGEPPAQDIYVFQDLDSNVQKDNYKSPGININNATQGTQFRDQGLDQYPAPGQPSIDQDQGTPTNPENQTGQNSQNADNRSPALEQTNPEERFSESFPVMESEQPTSKVTHEEALFNLQEEMNNHKVFLLQAVLTFIDHAQGEIKTQRQTNKETDISKNAQQLFHRTEELFYYYSTAAELEQNVAKKAEWKEKAAEQLKEIQNNPLYSKEINNEPEQRDICERVGRFIGNTTSRVIGLGLGFGAAVAVASLMIPPAMVLYGPMIVAGPVVVAGAGGAAAFMANKLGYKIADITLSNTTALAGRVLDGLRDWWNKDKEQVKALTTLKNQLLQKIEEAQLGFIAARNQNDQTQMTEHLENLYINASVLKDLETSIVGQRNAEQKQQAALEEWKKNSSFMERAAKKMGATESWKSISETGPRNICEKLGVMTGKIVGLAIAVGLGAAAAIAITSSIGAAATILYGPMAVVGITAAAGIAAGAVGYKIANPVATWSFKKVGQVADLAKNATYEVAKSMAVAVVMGKGKYSNKVKKEAEQGQTGQKSKY